MSRHHLGGSFYISARLSWRFTPLPFPRRILRRQSAASLFRSAVFLSIFAGTPNVSVSGSILILMTLAAEVAVRPITGRSMAAERSAPTPAPPAAHTTALNPIAVAQEYARTVRTHRRRSHPDACRNERCGNFNLPIFLAPSAYRSFGATGEAPRHPCKGRHLIVRRRDQTPQADGQDRRHPAEPGQQGPSQPDLRDQRRDLPADLREDRLHLPAVPRRRRGSGDGPAAQSLRRGPPLRDGRPDHPPELAGEGAARDRAAVAHVHRPQRHAVRDRLNGRLRPGRLPRRCGRGHERLRRLPPAPVHAATRPSVVRAGVCQLGHARPARALHPGGSGRGRDVQAARQGFEGQRGTCSPTPTSCSSGG